MSLSIAVACIALKSCCVPQDPNGGTVLIPESSMAVFDGGLTAHTNHLIWLPEPVPVAAEAELSGPQSSAPPHGLCPSQVRAAYRIPSIAGSRAIAIVDAYHYATALDDFNVFARQFGLPTESSKVATSSSNKVLQVVYSNGKQPGSNSGWSEEASLDIEWAHAVAPNAKIYLVEAPSNSTNDLMTAARVAAALPGVSEVSMSWSMPEFSTQTYNDWQFNVGGVVFCAATGDSGAGAEYPASSPNVVAVGGTTLKMSQLTFTSEAPWANAGGGASGYEPLPACQSMFSSFLKGRGTPDISAVADPATGVAVYDSTPGSCGTGWIVMGGTSVACPIIAAIANDAGTWLNTSALELKKLYGGLGTSAFRSVPITAANLKSRAPGNPAITKGWNFITGVGVPNGPGGL